MKHSLAIKGYRNFIIIIFFGLASTTLVATFRYWTGNFLNRDGLVLQNGSPVGGDFLAFYNAGSIFDRNPSRLYDLQYQWEQQKKLFKDFPQVAALPLPFVYPPLVVFPFKYLSRVDFVNAFEAWVVIGIGVYLLSLFLLARALRIAGLKLLAFIFLGLGFSPFLNLSVISGHASFFGVLVFSAVFFSLSRRRDFLAGVLLSLSYYKPPLFLVFVLLTLLKRNPNQILGFVTGGASLILLSLTLSGTDSFLEFLNNLTRYHYGAEVNPGIVFTPKQGAGLLAALTTAFRGQFEIARIIYLGIALLLSSYFYKVSKPAPKTAKAFNLEFALLISLSLFLSLQMVDYDLSILIVPILIVGDYLWRLPASKKNFQRLLILFLVYVGWNFNHYFIQNFESIYSSLMLILWIILLRLLLLEARENLPEANGAV